MNSNFSVSNKNLLTLSMDTFRVFGRAITDVLENQSNDLTVAEKIFWTRQLIEVIKLLESSITLAETVIKSEEQENIRKIIPVKNSQWN